MKSCAIVGGGIVGLAVARKLLVARPGLRVVLLEKEQDVGRHQSTHNSGVLHAGLYYKPGSIKARMAVSGIKQMTAFCRDNSIPHEICGKVVVAVSDEEIPRLRSLLERGTSNGLRGLAWLTPEQLCEREPHAAGKAAVLVPEEGIVDYAAVCQALRQEIVRAGGTIRLNFPVERIRRVTENWRLESPEDAVEVEFLINCAGLHCDRVGELAGVTRTTRIVPFRGEYYMIRAERQHLVRHLIYPVPDPVFPFLGVHFTRLIHGGLEAGPNAVLALKREGYSRTSFALRDAADSLFFPGLWKFVARHARMCAEEMARSFSKTLFCRSLQRLVPELQEEDLTPGGCGVRAQAMTSEGILQQDFEIRQDRFALHLLNAPSPAATASLAIADEIVGRLENDNALAA
ncbi:MAG: L-2-hydroxyglutarate oxidase [Methylacidiphilales bacterium]|nr:L-2-hydroxyglutarate oxidase [Candidatus Methylacidiphilales bacterium]